MDRRIKCKCTIKYCGLRLVNLDFYENLESQSGDRILRKIDTLLVIVFNVLLNDPWEQEHNIVYCLNLIRGGFNIDFYVVKNRIQNFDKISKPRK